MPDDDGCLTATSEHPDGRPVIIVGVPIGSLEPGGLGAMTFSLGKKFPNVDLKNAELIVMVGPTLSSLVTSLSSIIKTDTEVTYDGKPLPKA